MNVGETQYITLDLVTKGVHGETYSVSSEDSSIAQVGWTDIDSKELPWSITIVGLSPGTTFLNITNDYNGQYARVQLIVAGVAASSGKDAVSYLKTMISRNGTYSNGVYCVDVPIKSDYGIYFERLGYNVSKDELFTEFISYASPPNDYCTYSLLEFHSDGTCSFVTAFYSDKKSSDPATYGSATIYSRTYTMSDSIYLSYYDGYSDIRETFSQLCASQLNLMLLYLNDYLRYYIGGISIADLGFTNFN